MFDLKRLTLVFVLMLCVFSASCAESDALYSVLQEPVPERAVQIVCVLPKNQVYSVFCAPGTATLEQAYNGRSYQLYLEQPIMDFFEDERKRGTAFVHKKDQKACSAETFDKTVQDTVLYKPCDFFSVKMMEFLSSYGFKYVKPSAYGGEERVRLSALLQQMLGRFKTFKWSVVENDCLDQEALDARNYTNQVFVRVPGVAVFRGAPQIRLLSKDTVHKRSVYCVEMEQLILDALPYKKTRFCLEKNRYGYGIAKLSVYPLL